MIRRPMLRNPIRSRARFPFGWELDVSGTQEV
jgi:hypothetical protein